MVQAIIAGLIVAAIVAVAALFRRSATDAVRRMTPLHVSAATVVGDEWTVSLSGQLDSTVRALEGNVPSRDVYTRLRAAGAADFGETRVRISLRGLSDEAVVIRNVSAHVERSLPLAGTRVFCSTAGANSATLLVIDLDHDDAPAWEWREDGGRDRVGALPYFDTHTISLSRGEVHDLIVIGEAKQSYARWKLALIVTVGKHASVIEVDDSGKPFMTSGEPAGGFIDKLEWAWDLGGRFIPEREWDMGGQAE